MDILIAAAGSALTVIAVGAWLFPRDRGAAVTGLAWREYEQAKREGCKL
jgi:hypothetical protein